MGEEGVLQGCAQLFGKYIELKEVNRRVEGSVFIFTHSDLRLIRQTFSNLTRMATPLIVIQSRVTEWLNTVASYYQVLGIAV